MFSQIWFSLFSVLLEPNKEHLMFTIDNLEHIVAIVLNLFLLIIKGFYKGLVHLMFNNSHIINKDSINDKKRYVIESNVRTAGFSTKLHIFYPNLEQILF